MQIGAPRTSADILVHHVTLDKAVGISVAFGSGDLLAILSHTGVGPDYSKFSGLETYAIWTYCPLSTAEVITGVWGFFYEYLNLRICGLVVGYIIRLGV